MATTITSGFQKFKENLEITGLQATATASRQKNVREHVETQMTVLSSFLTGSYMRSTMIAPLADADIDVFLVMDNSYFNDGQISLLEKVKRSLSKGYPDSKISRDGQAITIKFSDFWVDIVPSFNRQGGGYLIPDSIERRWIPTNPSKHVELWSALNTLRDGKFVPLVKMLKSWNRAHSQTLRSFHLETLVYNVFQSTAIADYPSAAKHFFSVAGSYITYGSFDPAGLGGDVGSYLDTTAKKDDVKSRLTAAYQKASEATILASEGKTEAAFSKWRIIFGNYFPAYG